jgi:hypothetical protein
MSAESSMADSLLPPRFRRGTAPSNSGRAARRTVAPLFPAGLVAPPWDGILPPRRYSPRFRLAAAEKAAGRDGEYVLLPDGAGGFQRVSNRTVRMQSGGEPVSLQSRTPAQALRFRILVNLIAIVMGLAILFGVVWLALNGYV